MAQYIEHGMFRLPKLFHVYRASLDLYRYRPKDFTAVISAGKYNNDSTLFETVI